MSEAPESIAAKSDSNASIYFQLTLTALFWSGAFFAGKLALVWATPMETAAARFLTAGAILLAVLRWRSGLHSVLDRAFLVQAVMLGLIGITLYNVFFFHGLAQTAPLNASLIVASNPSMTALLAWFFRGERPSARAAAGIALSFSGVAIVASNASLKQLLQLHFGPGDLMIVGSSFCWAIYSLFSQRLMRQRGALELAAWSTSAGALLLIPLAMLESRGLQWLGRPAATLSILYMAALASALAFTLWNRGVARLGAPRSAIFINLVPLFSFLISLASGVQPGLAQIAGGAAILSGVYLTSAPSRVATARRAESAAAGGKDHGRG
ncbi:MAG: DMT family transporter [Leptospirales bacterium]|nr:DMT family transporter [Leptospirales bacterium]